MIIKNNKTAAVLYFVIYCQACEAKCPSTMGLLLKLLNDLGYDVKEIGGKNCLVKREKP